METKCREDAICLMEWSSCDDYCFICATITTALLWPLQHDSPAMDDGCWSVRVTVRVRPLVEKEIVEECIKYGQEVLGKDCRLIFWSCLCIKHLVDSCCAGS